MALVFYKPVELAKIVGVSAQTLRVWEAKGLIPAADRTLGGHRRFTTVHLQRIRELQQANQPKG